MKLHPLAAAALAAAAPAWANHGGPVTGAPQTIIIDGHYDNAVGTTDAATAGTIRAELLKSRPAQRPGEVLEFVPGIIVTQHSGDGKANQYFLRGFNLDHGTDFATRIARGRFDEPTVRAALAHLEANGAKAGHLSLVRRAYGLEG